MKCHYCDAPIGIDDPRVNIGCGEYSCGCNVTKLDNPRPFNVYSAPDVQLVARTHYDDLAVQKWGESRGFSYYTDAIGDADALSEFAGRLCYLSFNEKLRRRVGEGQNRAYLDHIREVGHGSVTEHSYWSFVIDCVSRNMTHELVRHRVGVAYSQLSTRYVDQFSDEYFGDSGHSLGVYVPPEIQAVRNLYEEWLEVWEKVVSTYQKSFALLREQGYEKKHARSIARHILPGSACTAILFTVNARELNHIFAMRGSLHADDEIRRMALRLYDFVKEENLFVQWEIADHPLKGRYLKLRDDDFQSKLAKLIGPKPDLDAMDQVLLEYGYNREHLMSCDTHSEVAV